MGSDDGNLKPVKIVGIGASAGGLNALESLFDELNPTSGMAFIVVQHLSPDFDSIMDQLLSRHTQMQVTLIEDGMPVEANRIHLLPPGKQVIISNDKLLLAERAEGTSLAFPVDELFRSLAQNVGENAIGIILSGTGSDGSRGGRDIAAAGGVVIVQSLESANFDGMPRSACNTGVVDLILSPGEIAKTLHRMANEEWPQHEKERNSDSMELVDHMAPSMRLIFHLLHQKFGLDFSHYKSDMIARRVERRVKLSGVSDLESYADSLTEEGDEINLLYHDMLIGVTDFFRDCKVFERLQLDVIPSAVDNLHEEEEFRCWVAGTASGEEAYSLAILLAEEFSKRGIEKRIRIFASDVHEQSLAAAGRGVYSHDQLGNVTPERRERFFIERQDGFHVAPELRKMVVFTPHNVIRDAPFTRLDLITCRNLLIYFTPPTQQRVLSLFHFGLKTGGTLCLGGSESLGNLRSEFQAIDETSRIFRKDREVPSTGIRGTLNRVAWTHTTDTTPPPDRDATRQLLKTYDQLLKRLNCPALLVNEKREVLHVLGGAGKYLVFSDGRPTNDVLQVIHPELRSHLSLALIHLRRDKHPVTVEPVKCEINNQVTGIALTAETFESGDEEAQTVLITLQVTDISADAEVSPTLLSAAELSNVEHLERELQFTQDNLQSTIEELQSTNEELQSTNEQMTASNEELQSTNEELHSVNEELYTVNAEHQRKIDELTELNDDIDNLLTTTNVHTLFLDSNLRLRRFTPRIAELFNLIPQDIGRRIDSFTHKLQDATLTEAIREVIRTEQPVHREIKDQSSQWYLLRIFPYLSRGTVEGAVVTLVDVTTLQVATEALKKSEERFDLAVRGSNAGIWDWQNVKQEPIWCSSRMYALLGRPPEQELTVSYWRELIHPEDEQLVMDALASHLERGTPFDIEYRMEHGASEEYRWFHMRGSADRFGADRVVRMAGSFEDVTDRRLAEEGVQKAVARRDQFLAMLSHELRNPLGAVTNATAVLASGAADESITRKALEVVRRQLNQMSRLLDDLLDVSRITHGKIELRTGKVDLRHIVEQAISVVRRSLNDADLSFSVEMPTEALVVDGDPARLEQVTVNLLTNAIKYTPAGGDIRLSLQAEGGFGVIEVQDTGVGIPRDKLQEIFSLFYQSDETLDRSNGGMGVGLTLVMAVVELHKGKVTARSNGPGRGSTFTVTLPLSTSAQLAVAGPVARPSVAIRQVVLVEDIDDAREMLATLLALRGLSVHEGRDGAEGLELIRKVRPDAAIIDIGLPEMDGHEVARRIRNDSSFDDVRLVALTGYGQDADREAVRESGFDLHLVKPLNPESLDTILSELADIQRGPAKTNV
ncbi:chemotaxis protein CheB [Fuerstiella marisgermanici]|uniref:Sensor protein EvgS n=1 Tax=Fuerstiella marisgermanici TaxID=1891926 RepID=A0A1P8WDU9_9PLAN|nr:chemotaxis protein CheB [Fuerstiella marisgermanici]APZ92232.1 Sensor protein EvgS precursor [Fuerstiella marisgermanici]